MTYALDEYTGNGAQQNYAVTFPYLATDHVLVTVAGSSAAFTWLNPSTVTITTAPASGAAVRISRDSSRDTPLVDFTNGAALTESDLDTAFLQAMYIAQEAFDASDAVINTQALQDMVDAAELAAAESAGSASDAHTDALAAAASALAASGSATAASGSAIAADASADAAALSEAAAAGYATSALLKASNLSDLTNAGTARTNLGLGSAATTAATAYATAAQGALADSALQPGALVTTEAATIVGDGSAASFLAGKLLELKSSTANTDGGRWGIGHLKSGADDFLSLFTITDAGALGAPVFQVKRTGSSYSDMTWYGTHVFAGLTANTVGVGTGGAYTFDEDAGTYFDAVTVSAPQGLIEQYTNPAVVSLGTSLTGTPTLNISTANRYSGTLTGSITPTLTAPTYPTTVRIMFTQGGSGSYTLTLPAAVKWPASYDATAKALSTAVGAKDLLILDWDGSIYVANLLKGIA